MRGIAALMVLFYHVQYGADYHLPFEQATALFQRGYLMVDLFFILSGFIISHVNRADRGVAYDRKEARDFLLRRLARIYPLLLFTLVALLAFRIMAQMLDVGSAMVPWDRHSILNLVAQLLLLNAWLPFGGGWNTPSWSISAEMFTYLLFPPIVSLNCRMPMLNRALLLFAATLFYALVAVDSGSLDIIAGIAPFRCLAGFSVGMLIFYGRERIAALPPTMLATLQIVAGVASILLLAVSSNDVLIILPFALLVASCWTDCGPVGRALGCALGCAPLLWLGDRSYSIYLNHLFIRSIFIVPWSYMTRHIALDPAIARTAYLIGYTAIVLLVSHFTFRLIEIPARRRLTQAWLGHPPVAIAAAAPAP